MLCWHCGSEVIWGNDVDISHEDEEFAVETNLTCSNCKSFYVIYYPKKEEEINGEVVANMGKESR